MKENFNEQSLYDIQVKNFAKKIIKHLDLLGWFLFGAICIFLLFYFTYYA